ncbi:MAG: hypothetical protein WAK20_14280 [Candidatus Acidiferrum sp.]
MIRPADLTLWLLTTFVEGFVVYLFLIQGLLRKFIFLNMYLLLSAVIGVVRYVMYSHIGFIREVYFSSEALLMVFLLLSICELNLVLAGDRIHRRTMTLWSSGAFVIALLSSLPVLGSMGSGVAIRFLIELSQQLFYVCCIAGVLLWVWKLGHDPAERIAARLADVLAVYSSLFLIIYGASQLVSRTASLDCLSQMSFAWLPLGCGFVIVSCRPQSH